MCIFMSTENFLSTTCSALLVLGAWWHPHLETMASCCVLACTIHMKAALIGNFSCMVVSCSLHFPSLCAVITDALHMLTWMYYKIAQFTHAFILMPLLSYQESWFLHNVIWEPWCTLQSLRISGHLRDFLVKLDNILTHAGSVGMHYVSLLDSCCSRNCHNYIK